MCRHYVDDTMDNNPTLVLAHQAQDHVLSSPWDTKINNLERRRAETHTKLAALRQAISEAHGKLAEARQDCAHLVEADNKPRCRLADASHRVMAQPQDGLEEEHEHHVSTPGPSSFQLHECPRPPSYPRPTDPSQTTEHETIYISSDSNDDVSLIPPAPNSQFLKCD